MVDLEKKNCMDGCNFIVYITKLKNIHWYLPCNEFYQVVDSKNFVIV